MFNTIRECRCAILLAMTLLALWPPGQSAAQTSPPSVVLPRYLELSGSPHTTLVVQILYFEQERLARTTLEPVDLDGGLAEVDLDDASSTAQITIVSPSTAPAAAKIFLGDDLIAQAAGNGIGPFRLSYGKVPDDAPQLLPRVLPDDGERKWIELFRQAIDQAETRELVADSDDVATDWPTLDAYCTALKSYLGDLEPSPTPADGWLSWEGEKEQRVLQGNLQFTGGHCRLKILLQEGKILQVDADSPQLPEFWYAGPVSTTPYQAQALALAEALFQGQAELAQQKFARRFHEDVTVEVLDDLSKQLQQRFGKRVVSSQLIATQLGPFDAEDQSQRLTLTHSLHMDSDVVCVSRVDFLVACGSQSVGRAHLMSINMFESWRSSAPEQVRVAYAALEALLGNASSPTDLLELTATGIASLSDAERLKDIQAKASKRFALAAEKPQWDLWTVVQAGSCTRARGLVPVQQTEIANETELEVWVDLHDDKLVGVTLLGNQFAVSTLDAIEPVPDAEQLAVEFWKSLLGGDANGAYQYLAPEFRSQLPSTDFEEMVQQAKLGAEAKLSDIRVETVRLADRVERALPAMLAVYLLAEFGDGSVQPLRCELQAADGAPLLLNFSTDFEAVFPVEPNDLPKRLLEPFRTGSSARVAQLAGPRDRQNIDLQVLGAFLRKLRMVAGDFEVQPAASLLHHYATGKRIERLRSAVSTSDGSVPVQFTLQYGDLKTFDFYWQPLTGFAQLIEDKSSASQLVENFVRDWLEGTEAAKLKSKLSPSLQDEATATKLATLRETVTRQNGQATSITVESVQLQDDNETFLAECLVKFAFTELRFQVTLEVDAISYRILALQVRR